MADVIARWEAVAGTLQWATPWTRAYDPDSASGRWFVDGRLNLAVNLVHRHVDERADAPALLWEGEPGDRRTITYRELHREVEACATALDALGVTVGDRVALYAGLTPETLVTMLACAHLGAPWCVLPAVLPEDALFERLQDLDPRVLVTQDGAWRHGVVLPLKARADEVIAARGGVEHTIVIRRAGIDVNWYEGDRWYHDFVASGSPESGQATPPPAPVSADAAALITYVANRRGRPVGVVHTVAGLLVYCHEIHTGTLGLGTDDIIWTPAELGWIAGQTHGLIGPLSAGGTAVVFEGMLDTPAHGRAWEMVARYHVNALLATPSVVRSLRRWVDAPPTPEQVSSLRTIVTAGEPIDEGTLSWLTHDVGRGRVQVTNAWGQTELGGFVHLDPPLEGGRPVPDSGLTVVDEGGKPVPVGEVGDLVLTKPWPAASPAILNDPEAGPGVDRTRPGVFVTGDRARQLPDGSVEFLGRSDRVINVSGQLVSATEVRQAIEDHPLVERAEVVDRPDTSTGQAVVAAVVLVSGTSPADTLAADLRLHVRELLGGLAQPQTVALIDEFPEGLTDHQLARALQALCNTPEPFLHLETSRVRLAGEAMRD